MVIATDDLEVACPNVKEQEKSKEHLALACSGKGVILTAQGYTLLDFIQKHLNK